jgi:uncharacterized protein (TIGR02145 family)
MKGKIKIWSYPLVILGMLLFFTNSCKKDKNIPLETGTVTDVEGRVYQTVKIGDQWWMAENLRTTKYNDFTKIPLVKDSISWKKLTTPAYCYYRNDESKYKNIYGALYNWFAVNTGKLAPKGWHVPTDADWNALCSFLGGENVAGGKMKETGTAYWEWPNDMASNERGFTARPGGMRSIGFYSDTTEWRFQSLQYSGFWWASTEFATSNTKYAWKLYLSCYTSNFALFEADKNKGLSVRCVKD